MTANSDEVVNTKGYEVYTEPEPNIAKIGNSYYGHIPMEMIKALAQQYNCTPEELHKHAKFVTLFIPDEGGLLSKARNSSVIFRLGEKDG